ncbi:MAG: C-terminal binding protein [Chloroflexi bacterium]|nr:C-terminal binding protein [Chloroflexota bacterium]
MSFKVVHTFYESGMDIREQILEPLDVVLVKGMWRTEHEVIANAGDADALVVSGSIQPISRRVIDALSKCRIIANQSIGFDKTDVSAATERCIVFTNVPDFCIDEVSGRAIAFMLALNHKLFVLDRIVKGSQVFFPMNRKLMRESVAPIFRMREQTLGLIGFGEIGLATALKARGLGMRVLAYDPYVFEGAARSRGVVPVDLDTLLRESDYVSLHSPLTPETRHMLGYDEFRRMKPTAYLVNTGRGECVIEADLIRALREGLIAGAGLDVTDPEPPAPDNPLLAMPNVILTGHSAGYSESAAPELFYKPITQIAAALRGEWPTYAVNKTLKPKWLEKWGRK